MTGRILDFPPLIVSSPTRVRSWLGRLPLPGMNDDDARVVWDCLVGANRYNGYMSVASYLLAYGVVRRITRQNGVKQDGIMPSTTC